MLLVASETDLLHRFQEHSVAGVVRHVIQVLLVDLGDRNYSSWLVQGVVQHGVGTPSLTTHRDVANLIKY